MELDVLLKLMTDRGASDLHLKPTRPPLLRIAGRLMPIDVPPIAPDALSQMLIGILSAPQRNRLEEKLSVDVGYGVKGLARFRATISLPRANLAACSRRVPVEIRSLEDLQL